MDFTYTTKTRPLVRFKDYIIYLDAVSLIEPNFEYTGSVQEAGLRKPKVQITNAIIYLTGKDSPVKIPCNEAEYRALIDAIQPVDESDEDEYEDDADPYPQEIYLERPDPNE